MRGSRPGERRGGRQKGTPNKKTAFRNAVIAARSANENLTPLDVMLAVMRDPQVSLADRVKMALKALPRLHRKPKAGQSGNAIAAQLRCKASAGRKTLLAAVRAKTRRQPSGIQLAELAKKDRPRQAPLRPRSLRRAQRAPRKGASAPA